MDHSLFIVTCFRKHIQTNVNKPDAHFLLPYKLCSFKIPRLNLRTRVNQAAKMVSQNSWRISGGLEGFSVRSIGPLDRRSFLYFFRLMWYENSINMVS